LSTELSGVSLREVERENQRRLKKKTANTKEKTANSFLERLAR